MSKNWSNFASRLSDEQILIRGTEAIFDAKTQIRNEVQIKCPKTKKDPPRHHAREGRVGTG